MSFCMLHLSIPLRNSFALDDWFIIRATQNCKFSKPNMHCVKFLPANGIFFTKTNLYGVVRILVLKLVRNAHNTSSTFSDHSFLLLPIDRSRIIFNVWLWLWFAHLFVDGRVLKICGVHHIFVTLCLVVNFQSKFPDRLLEPLVHPNVKTIFLGMLLPHKHHLLVRFVLPPILRHSQPPLVCTYSLEKLEMVP